MGSLQERDAVSGNRRPVRPIHAKAMPVILPAGEAWDVWLEGETEKALELARLFPEGDLKVVARGKREDG